MDRNPNAPCQIESGVRILAFLLALAAAAAATTDADGPYAVESVPNLLLSG